MFRARLLIVLAVASRAAATDVYVDAGGGSDAADGLSWATAKATMNAGLAVALATPEPDVIRIAEGTYVEQLRWTNHGISLLGGYPSGGGAADPSRHRTVMLGSGQEYLLSASTREDSCVIGGMTFQGRVGRSFVSFLCPNAQVTRCEFVGHQSRGCGPALYILATDRASGNGRVVVEDCRFTDNCVPLTDDDILSATAFLAYDVRVLTMRRCSFDRNTPPTEGRIVDFMTEALPPLITLEDVTADSAFIPAWNLVASNVLFRRRLYAGVSSLGTAEYRNATVGQLVDNTYYQPVGMRDSIITGIVDGRPVPAVVGYDGPPRLTAENCIIAGGWPGTNVLDVDPLLVSGPQGDHYLAHVATGHPATSPAVDAGGGTAGDASVDDVTTRIDSVLDTGTVDMGYHFRPTGMLTIRRGTTPDGLSAHATTDRLPWTDGPGVASDASLNPLFYDIPEAANEILVRRDLATDSLTLTWR